MIIFTISGAPRPKDRPRSRWIPGKGGKGGFVQHYTTQETRKFEEMVGKLAQKAMLEQNASMIEGPVGITFRFIFEPPTSWPKWKKQAALVGHIRHTQKPDMDNVEKAIKDGMEGIVYRNDSQVVEKPNVDMRYGPAALAVVQVWQAFGLPASVATLREYEEFLRGLK